MIDANPVSYFGPDYIDYNTKQKNKNKKKALSHEQNACGESSAINKRISLFRLQFLGIKISTYKF